MRSNLRHGGMAAALIAALAIGGAARAQAPAADPAATPAAEKPRSDIDKVGDTVENIGTKPLKDLNIIKADVSPEIERIMARPYALDGLKTCTQYRAAITRLTEVLGPDVDSPRLQKAEKSPAEVALDLGESAASGIIPFSGIIRRISGAESQQKYAKAVIYAGSVRRAYLKGLVRGKGCKA